MPQLFPNPISSNAYLTINAGDGLTGGGQVQLGGSVSLALANAANARNCYNVTPTPDGTIVQFTIVNGATPIPAYIDVYVNRLLQDTSAYSVNGNVVTFVTAPAVGVPINVVYGVDDTRAQYALSPIGVSTTNFQFPTGVNPDSIYVDVFAAGVLQDTTAYSLNYTAGSWSVVFGVAPATSDLVAVFSTSSFSSRNLYHTTPVTDSSTTKFTIHGGTPVAFYADTYVNGLFQSSLSDYTLDIAAGIWKLNFTTAPTTGQTIQVVF